MLLCVEFVSFETWFISFLLMLLCIAVYVAFSYLFCEDGKNLVCFLLNVSLLIITVVEVCLLSVALKILHLYL